MSTIASELNTTRETKAALQAALKSRGQATAGKVFSDWPALVSQIGGDTAAMQTKTAIPAATDVEVTPDDGIAGLLKVLIEADINHKPYNIMDGITIHGVTGTAKPYVVTDGTWPFPSTDIEPGPHEPPTEEEVDNAVKEDDPDVNTEDKMVLAQNDGNITVGYLYTEPDSGLMVYGGAVLPGTDSVYTDELKETHPYAVITYAERLGGDLDPRYLLYFTAEKPLAAGYSQDEVQYYVPMTSYVRYVFREGDSSWAFDTQSDASSISLGVVVWTKDDIVNKNTNAVSFRASTPTEYNGFQITWYDPLTTEFRAVGWRRVSKHTTGEDAGKITRDDFTRTESGGWNYLKNIRSCTREKLYFQGVEVWPECKL